MKKIFLSGLVIFGFLFYSVNKQNGNANSVSAGISLPSPTPSFPTSSSSDVSQGVMPSMPNRQMTMAGMYKDGTYTGSVADAYYGNVRVQAKITDGKISEVVFLQYPNDRSTSVEINSQAMPYLQQESISAQNANVDIVSGATQTSLAFIQSLQSALNQAK